MNALDDIRIRSGADTVTEEEAGAVITWLREWLADCEGSQVVADMDTPALLRYCDAAIEGGIAFVLADVRRCAVPTLQPTGYGIDPADGSSTEERAKAARIRREQEADKIEEMETALEG